MSLALRRVLLLGIGLLAFAADPATDAASVITQLAAALTAGDVQAFMAAFDPAFPGREKLEANVAALGRQGETESYIEVTKNDGDDHVRTLEVSWELHLRRSGDALPYANRDVKVTCKLETRGKQWRVTEFTPVDFLAP